MIISLPNESPLAFHSMHEFISCDWGTSRLRLAWLRDGVIVAEDNAGPGIAQCAASKDFPPGPEDRKDYFRALLRSKVRELAGPEAALHLPIVASGMISSNLGMKMLPYAPLPFDLNREIFIFHQFPANEFFPDLYLISGLRTEQDIMRGEETQLLGLVDILSREYSHVILPGTHSKHVRIEAGVVTAFNTYLTGELYALLMSKSTIIRPEAPGGFRPSGFVQGLEAAKREGLPASLFTVRSRSILGKLREEDAASYLSGLLIGAEILAIKPASVQLVLAAAMHLAEPYEQALQYFDLAYHKIDPLKIERLVPLAHRRFLQQTYPHATTV